MTNSDTDSFERLIAKARETENELRTLGDQKNADLVSSLCDALEVERVERMRERTRSYGTWSNQRENGVLTIKYYEMKDRAEAAEKRLQEIETPPSRLLRHHS